MIKAKRIVVDPDFRMTLSSAEMEDQIFKILGIDLAAQEGLVMRATINMSAREPIVVDMVIEIDDPEEDSEVTYTAIADPEPKMKILPENQE